MWPLPQKGVTTRNGNLSTLRRSGGSFVLKNAPECDYSSFYVMTGKNTGCLVAQDLALLTKVRIPIHEEISLLTVLYFPFRARTPRMEQAGTEGKLTAMSCTNPISDSLDEVVEAHSQQPRRGFSVQVLHHRIALGTPRGRSEERRVGKECQ